MVQGERSRATAGRGRHEDRALRGRICKESEELWNRGAE